MNTIIIQLKQPSTWRGILMLATAAGFTLSPEMQNVIMSLGIGAVGLVGVLTKD
jgi:hypothetical protein